MSESDAYTWPPVWLPSRARDWLPFDWLELVSRVVALINGKGGVGKTSATANLGGLAAQGGQKTLVIDANAQGNISRELGIRRKSAEVPGIDDQGEAFYEAIRKGAPLVPVRDVRPGLDVVVGGRVLEDLGSLIIGMIGKGLGDAAYLALARSLVPIAAEYDLIFIDSPPENPTVERLVLTTSRYLIIPTKSDDSSIDGLGMVADRYTDALTLNPWLEVLAVLLFDTGRDFTKIHREVKTRIESMLGTVAPVFDHVIGHAEKVAREARVKGKLIFELEESRVDRLRNPNDPARKRTPVEMLSEDYDGIFEQFIRLLTERETAEAEEIHA